MIERMTHGHHFRAHRDNANNHVMTVLAPTEGRTALHLRRPGLRVSLLGGFQLIAGDDVLAVSGGAERLLAFVAIRDQVLERQRVAGSLWADATEGHAYAALRSALTRMCGDSRKALLVTTGSLELAKGVAVDLRDAQALAHRLLEAVPPAATDLSAPSIATLSLELLPLWYDDWILVEAEDWRQLRLHALEAMVKSLVATKRFGDATAAAGAVVRADPLRESAQAALIHVHLAEGNQSEAVRVFDRFSRLLHADLGLLPTHRLQDLIVDRRDPRAQNPATH